MMPTRSAPHPPRHLRRQPLNALSDTRYLRYFVGTCLSFAGNTAHVFATAMAVLALGASPALVPLLMLVSTLTSVLCSVTLAQRFAGAEHRRTLLVIDVYSVAVIGLLCVALSLRPSVTAVFAAEVCLAVGGALHYPASRGFVRRLLTPDRLLSGNAMLGVAFQLGTLIGGGLGALLLKEAGIVAAFTFNGATFALSALLLWKTPARSDLTEPGVEPATGSGPERPARSNVGNKRRLTLVGQAIMAFRSRPDMLPLVSVMISFLLLQRALVSIGPGVVVTTLGRPPSDFGFLLAAFAGGSLLGGIWLSRWSGVAGRRWVHVIYPATAAFLVVFPLVGRVEGFIALVCAGCCFQGWTVYQTIIQRGLDAAAESRLLGVVGGVQSAALACCFIMAGVSMRLFDPLGGFWLTLGAVVLLTLPFILFLALSPKRKLVYE